MNWRKKKKTATVNPILTKEAKNGWKFPIPLIGDSQNLTPRQLKAHWRSLIKYDPEGVIYQNKAALQRQNGNANLKSQGKITRYNSATKRIEVIIQKPGKSKLGAQKRKLRSQLKES